MERIVASQRLLSLQVENSAKQPAWTLLPLFKGLAACFFHKQTWRGGGREAPAQDLHRAPPKQAFETHIAILKGGKRAKFPAIQSLK